MLAQATGYAVTALGVVSRAGGRPLLVKDIAEAASLPPAYLAKIIHGLARKGIVQTQRGIGGGVTLARPALEISLFDVCVALNDPAVEATCMLGTAPCSDERACPAHKFWSQHRTRQIEYLKQITVADVAKFEFMKQVQGGSAPHAAPGASEPNTERA